MFWLFVNHGGSVLSCGSVIISFAHCVLNTALAGPQVVVLKSLSAVSFFRNRIIILVKFSLELMVTPR